MVKTSRQDMQLAAYPRRQSRTASDEGLFKARYVSAEDKRQKKKRPSTMNDNTLSPASIGRAPTLSHRDKMLELSSRETLLQPETRVDIEGRRRHPAGNEQRRVADLKSTVDVNEAHVLISVCRAILARLLFIVHSITTIWHTVTIQGRDGVWGFALLSILIVFEGSYTIIMRAGDERRWFSLWAKVPVSSISSALQELSRQYTTVNTSLARRRPPESCGSGERDGTHKFCTSLFLYIVATAPPIWLHQTKICEWRREFDLLGEGKVRTGGPEQELHLQLLEQLLLVVLIIGRWLLPKGDISREQLSQILLAYLAISSDIVEFFDVFKEKPVYNNVNVQRIVLAAWTLSLLQFPFVLTVSRARKMRVAITKTYEELIMPRSPPSFWAVFHDVDLWAIVLANSLQDIPFLLVRLYLMFQYGLVTYTMIFFTCKNALIIALQTYRAFVLLNDRYIHPKSPALDMLEPHHMHHTRDHPRKPAGRNRKRRTKRDKSEERQHLFSPHRERRRDRRKMDTLEETTA